MTPPLHEAAAAFRTTSVSKSVPFSADRTLRQTQRPGKDEVRVTSPLCMLAD